MTGINLVGRGMMETRKRNPPKLNRHQREGPRGLCTRKAVLWKSPSHGLIIWGRTLECGVQTDDGSQGLGPSVSGLEDLGLERWDGGMRRRGGDRRRNERSG